MKFSSQAIKLNYSVSKNGRTEILHSFDFHLGKKKKTIYASREFFISLNISQILCCLIVAYTSIETHIYFHIQTGPCSHVKLVFMCIFYYYYYVSYIFIGTVTCAIVCARSTVGSELKESYEIIYYLQHRLCLK